MLKQHQRKHYILTALLYCFAFSISFAQLPNHSPAIVTIRGNIADSASMTALSFVTIVVHEIGKDMPIKSILSDENGSFEMNGLLQNKQYRLIITYVGYKTKKTMLPTTTSRTISLGTIKLSSTPILLQEVQITTEKPLIVFDTEKLTYNAESDPEYSVLNSFDLLLKIPFLTSDLEDNLQLNGQSNYQILINGKRSALFDANANEAFKSLPASAIKKVEVITTPSSRYAADGIGGIINIITHKKSISGYNGALTLGLDNNKSYNTNAYLTATSGKFGYSGSVNYMVTTPPGSKSIFIRHDKINNNWLKQYTETQSNHNAINSGSQVTYDISPKSQVIVSYNLHKSNTTNNYEQQVKQLVNENELTEAYNNFNNNGTEANSHNLALDYQYSFSKDKQQLLTFAINSTQNTNNNTSYFVLEPVLNYAGQISTTNNQGNTRQYHLQADYTQPIGKQLLEFGLRSVFEQNNSEYFYKDLDIESNSFILDPDMSNSFDYRQVIHAAYVSISLHMGKWGLIIGTRLEDTKLDADFNSSGTETTQHYPNLFPNVMLSRMLKGSSRIKLSYNQRINRPGLYYLNPYIDQTDPLNISYGNPHLNPATSHAFMMEYSTFLKNTSLHVNTSHSFTNNSIEQFTTLGQDSVSRTTFANIGQNRNYSFILSANTIFFGKLTLNLNTGTNYITFNSTPYGNPNTSEGFTYNARGTINYRLGKGWRASGNLSYNSSNILLQGNTNGYTWSQLSVYKEFMKDNKVSLSLSVRSPFQKTRRSSTEIVNPAFYQYRESLSEIRHINLALNYRFGKLR